MRPQLDDIAVIRGSILVRIGRSPFPQQSEETIQQAKRKVVGLLGYRTPHGAPLSAEASALP
jgi:hypothetical protein